MKHRRQCLNECLSFTQIDWASPPKPGSPNSFWASHYFLASPLLGGGRAYANIWPAPEKVLREVNKNVPVLEGQPNTLGDERKQLRGCKKTFRSSPNIAEFLTVHLPPDGRTLLFYRHTYFVCCLKQRLYQSNLRFHCNKEQLSRLYQALGP